MTHSEQDDRLDEQQNSRVGTKRYMSPEVLDQSIDRFDLFQIFDLKLVIRMSPEVLDESIDSMTVVNLQSI